MPTALDTVRTHSFSITILLVTLPTSTIHILISVQTILVAIRFLLLHEFLSLLSGHFDW
jgi:hypothetical protein